jgi:uncharacterized membrane protein YcaP (DUF421 family)
MASLFRSLRYNGRVAKSRRAVHVSGDEVLGAGAKSCAGSALVAEKGSRLDLEACQEGVYPMRQLLGAGTELGWVAAKATLLYLTALVGFRVVRRRTLAEMSIFDFVAAVAAGAIVGRVPNSDSTSYLAGAVTLVSILILHAVITRLRLFPKVSPLFDHPPRLLVLHGAMIERELRRCGLTEKELSGLLRQQHVTDLNQVAFAILEQRGQLSVVRADAPGAGEGNLVREIVGEKERRR